MREMPNRNVGIGLTAAVLQRLDSSLGKLREATEAAACCEPTCCEPEAIQPERVTTTNGCCAR